MELPEDDKGLSRIPAYNGLKWQDRPSSINDWIEFTFNGLVNLSTEHWNFNGKAYYNHVGVDEDKLVKYLITSNPNQKKFYFLDMGAGSYQWGNHRATI